MDDGSQTRIVFPLTDKWRVSVLCCAVLEENKENQQHQPSDEPQYFNSRNRIVLLCVALRAPDTAYFALISFANFLDRQC